VQVCSEIINLAGIGVQRVVRFYANVEWSRKAGVTAPTCLADRDTASK